MKRSLTKNRLFFGGAIVESVDIVLGKIVEVPAKPRMWRSGMVLRRFGSRLFAFCRRVCR